MPEQLAPATTYAARAFAERRFLIYVRASPTQYCLPATTDSFQGVTFHIPLFHDVFAVDRLGWLWFHGRVTERHNASRRCTQR